MGGVVKTGEASKSVLDFQSPSSANNNLPTATTRVVGRDEIISVIRSELGNAQLVSIIGAGGIGKTTVALAVAEQSIGSFKDGVWLVDFAPLREPSLVANSIASAVGLVVHSASTLLALRRFLRDREILLVLDNCEHIVEAVAACVTKILEEAPNVRVLTTSRTSLRLAGERVHRLPGLATPSDSAVLTAQSALTFPAIQLFVERAIDRLDTFAFGDDEASAVAEICKRLDGIALAIELAAMRVDVFGVRGLQKQLDDRFHLLAGRRGGLERHRTLAATLDWSYSLLPESEAMLLRAVSVFAGAFRLSDAVALSNLSLPETSNKLEELTSKSLLSVDGEDRDLNYRPLETTRAYCLEKLPASGEEELFRHRYAEHICAVLERAVGEWGLQQSREWGTIYGRYLDDLRAALSWAGTHPAHKNLLIRLTAAGTLLWNHFSLTDESRLHLERAISELQEAGSAGTAVEMHLQLALAGALIYTRGIVPEAREAMQRGLQIAEQAGDTDFRLRCFRLIATYELFNGEHDSGIQTLETFLSIAAAEDPSALPEGETHLGVGEIFVGRLFSARQRLERLYEHNVRDFNDARFVRFQYSNSVNIMVVLSHAQWLTGAPDAAARTAAMMVEYGQESKHELSLSIALAWSCLILLWMGRDEECRRHVTMLDELVERHGIATWRPIATFCRGASIDPRQSGASDQLADFERAIAEFRSIRHMARLPYYLGVVAEAFARHGHFQKAEETIQEALDCASAQNERWCLPELLRIQASVCAAQGKTGDVEGLLIRAMAIAEDTGALSWRLRASNDLARLWQAQSRTVEAKHMLQPVYDAFTEGFETRDLLTAQKLLAELQ